MLVTKQPDKSGYFAIEFGRNKDNVMVFLKHPTNGSFEEFSRSFDDSVIDYVHNSIPLPVDQLSDFKLVESGIQGLLKKGYQFFNFEQLSYFQDQEGYHNNQELPFEAVRLLDEKHFNSFQSKDETDTLGAVSINSGIWENEFEIALFRSKGDKDKFIQDCNGFHPLTIPVKEMDRIDFIAMISDHLKFLNYSAIDFDRLTFICKNKGISEYWSHLIGVDFYRRLVFPDYNLNRIWYLVEVNTAARFYGSLDEGKVLIDHTPFQVPKGPTAHGRIRIVDFIGQCRELSHSMYHPVILDTASRIEVIDENSLYAERVSLEKPVTIDSLFAKFCNIHPGTIHFTDQANLQEHGVLPSVIKSVDKPLKKTSPRRSKLTTPCRLIFTTPAGAN